VTFAVGTGWTIVGNAVVLEATSAQFRARKTGVGTWTLYRIAECNMPRFGGVFIKETAWLTTLNLLV
jgi:hypothetical protein